MKKLLKALIGVCLLLALAAFILYISGYGYLFKAGQATYLRGETSATIDDMPYFDTHTVEAPEDSWDWPLADSYGKNILSDKLMSTLKETETVAFLVIQNDSIWYEQYWEGYSDSSYSNSFSMAKSIVTMLTQIAIQNGYLKSWNQPVKDIFPELKGPYADQLRLFHLTTMTAGMKWGEDYNNPFGVTAQSYYGPDVKKLILNLPIVEEPGKKFEYQSGSTQLLGLVLMKVTGKSLAELASEWLWKPMKANHPAKWHIDSKGTELAYCCFNSNARDFARFGKVMSEIGNFNENHILDVHFITAATKGAAVPYYGYSFWLGETNGIKWFDQQGILGQYIVTIPEKHLIIVRLGRHCLPEAENGPLDLDIIVEEILKTTN